jgi:hypothetical protein
VGREIDRNFGKCVQGNVMKFVGRKLCDIFISMMFVSGGGGIGSDMLNEFLSMSSNKRL